MRDTLSLERKLEMHEAREAILNRIGSETFSVINLDHFLQATVTEVGKMMGLSKSWSSRLHARAIELLKEHLARHAVEADRKPVPKPRARR